MTPTARTLKHYRDQGHLAAVVEHWIPRVFIRRDLFNIFDIVVLKPLEKQIWGVQATTNAHIQDRVAKMKSKTELQVWLSCGGKACVIGWAKLGKRGERKLWRATEVCL